MLRVLSGHLRKRELSERESGSVSRQFVTLESLGDANISLVRVAEALRSPPGEGEAASLTSS